MAIENKILTFGSNKVATVGGNSLMGFNKPFLPTSIDGCICWLENDPNSMIFNGVNVAQWSDKSGHDNHGIENTASNQPLWDTSESGVYIPNNNGGNTTKLTIDFGVTIERPQTIIIILQQDIGTATLPRAFNLNEGDTSRGYSSFTGLHAIYNRGTDFNLLVQGFGFSKRVYQFDNYGSNFFDFYQGNSLITNNTNAGSNNFNKIFLGNISTNIRGLNGRIYGFILYNSVLTTEERNNLYNNYIAPRYGL